MYIGVCSCRESHIGETLRNVEALWNEHNNPLKKSNPSKHITKKIDWVFYNLILVKAPSNMVWGKILKVYGILLGKLTLRENPEPKRLIFLLGYTPCKAEQPLRGMELQEKGAQKD